MPHISTNVGNTSNSLYNNHKYTISELEIHFRVKEKAVEDRLPTFFGYQYL